MRIGRKILQGLAAIVLALTVLSAEAAPSTGYFIYDEAGYLIGEYDTNGNAVQEHIYLGDRPVAVVQGGSVNYVTTDQLNTPRVVTDSSQTVEWSWVSDPFGNGQPTGSLTYNLRLPGQYSDAETGHDYNYFRDYDSTIGRYVEGDPTGIDGGMNIYVYANSDPLRIIDPSGLAPKPGSIRTVPCSADESAACQSTCAASGKTMESCRSVEQWRIRRIKQTDLGWVATVYGWKKINVSCSCNEPHHPMFCSAHPAVCTLMAVALGIGLCVAPEAAPILIPAL